jgi:pyruvate/2-oxoglutarate dehydrogenase complex dihydrolipoamide dehydrogenase (E3) component
VDVPPLAWAGVRERIRSVIRTIQKQDSEERFCSLGVDLRFGSPSFTDDHTLRVGGTLPSAKSWVLATGSSPAAPPIEGLDRTPFLTNRDLFSLDRLPASMIILGAGPVAVEMAQAFNRLGTRVTVVQRSGQILSREDRDMADRVMAVLREEGVDLLLDATVLRVREAGGWREVVVRAGGEERVLRAEAILVAMGRTPNVDELNLEGIGVDLERRGVRVDHRLRTSRRHIYAAGDVTGAYQFTHAAGYEGGIVVSNAVFHLPRKTDYTLMPRCTYTDPELAVVGMTEKEAEDDGIDCSVWSEPFEDNDRAQAEGEARGRLKMILDGKEKVIGVQILGPHAGDLLGEWVSVLNGGVKLSTLASAVHPYPTLGEINKRVAGQYLSTKIFSEKVQKGLRFFFHLKGRACGRGSDTGG